MRLSPTSSARAGALAVALALAAPIVLAPCCVLAQQGDAAAKRARELFKKSDESYRAGRFQEAIDLLDEAYRLDPKPVLLYNVARAYEGLGDTPKAIAAYRKYLDADPNANDRGALEQRIATLERQQTEREALEKQRDAAARQSQKDDAPRAPPPARSPSAVPWIVAGVGALGAGAGVVLGVLASGKHDDAVAEPGAQPALDLQGQAEDFALAANIALIAGAMIGTGGIVWGIVDVSRSGPSSAASPARVGVAIGPGSLLVRGAF